jgi:hypothetical protein
VRWCMYSRGQWRCGLHGNTRSAAKHGAPAFQPLSPPSPHVQCATQVDTLQGKGSMFGWDDVSGFLPSARGKGPAVGFCGVPVIDVNLPVMAMPGVCVCVCVCVCLCVSVCVYV